MKKVIFFTEGIVPTESELLEIEELNSNRYEVAVRNSSVNHSTENCDSVAGLKAPSAYKHSKLFKVTPEDSASPNYRICKDESTVVTTFQASHGFTFGTGAQNGNANYTDDFVTGTQCAYWETKGAGVQASCRKFANTAVDISNKIIRITFKVDNIKNISEIAMFAGDTSLANCFKWSIQTSGTANILPVISGEWTTVTLNLADASSIGSPNAANITDYSFAIYDNNTAAICSCKWQSLELIDIPVSKFPKGVISITFDDNYESVYTKAFAKMKALGLKGVSYNVIEYVGATNRMTQAQMDELASYGWEMSAHAYLAANHGTDFTVTDNPTAHADFKNSIKYLNAKKFSRGIAYPHGARNRRVVDRCKTFFTYGRTIISRTKETLPFGDRFGLRAVSSISNFTGGVLPSSIYTDTTGLIDKTKTYKNWLILVFHNITDETETATTQCKTSDFNLIMDKINTSGVPVMTVEEVLGLLGE